MKADYSKDLESRTPSLDVLSQFVITTNPNRRDTVVDPKIFEAIQETV